MHVLFIGLYVLFSYAFIGLLFVATLYELAELEDKNGHRRYDKLWRRIHWQAGSSTAEVLTAWGCFWLPIVMIWIVRFLVVRIFTILRKIIAWVLTLLPKQ